MKYLLTLSLLIAFTYLYPQKQGQEKIDSLSSELVKAEPDTSKVKILNELGWENFLAGNYEAAFEQSQTALTLARELQFKTGIGEAHNLIGVLSERQGDYPEALKNYTISLKIGEEIGDEQKIAGPYINIGIIYAIQGNYPEALNYFLSGLKILEKTNDKKRTAAVYVNIGNVYRIQGNHSEALENHFAALKILEEIGDKQIMANSYLNIGNIYEDQGNYAEAIQNHFTALKMSEEVGAKREMALAYNNIGVIHNKQGNLPEALENYLSSLKISEEIGHKQGTAETYINIGNVHTKLGRPLDGREWLQKGLQLSREIGAKEDIRDAYAGLASTYSALGNFKGAYEHYQLYSTYQDSLFNEENTRELTRAAMNYEFEKTQDSIRVVNEAEIAIRDATLAANRRQRGFFIGGLLALGVIGGLLYHQGRQRKKNNRILTVLNQELDAANNSKTLFISILNHDLRRPVANLIHFLQLKDEDPDLMDQHTRTRLEHQTKAGAEQLLATMEDLLLWSKGQMQHFKPYLRDISVQELFDQVTGSFSHEREDLMLTIEIPAGLSLHTDQQYLGTIIRNLTSNAVQALQNTENPRITWQCRQDGPHHTRLSIHDNGPGASEEKFRALYDDTAIVGIRSGLGMHLIRDLAKAIDCAIKVDSDPSAGTTITLML